MSLFININDEVITNLSEVRSFRLNDNLITIDFKDTSETEITLTNSSTAKEVFNDTYNQLLSLGQG